MCDINDTTQKPLLFPLFSLGNGQDFVNSASQSCLVIEKEDIEDRFLTYQFSFYTSEPGVRAGLFST